MKKLRFLPIVLFLSATPVFVLFTGCSQQEKLPAPQELFVGHNAEGPIQSLSWKEPDYEVSNYIVEWRFTEVPHWLEVSDGLLYSTQNGYVYAGERGIYGTLARELDAEYCYRVKAQTPVGSSSKWSDEACAQHWNYWWTQPGFQESNPGRVSELAVNFEQGSVYVSWAMEAARNPEQYKPGLTASVWRRPRERAAYEVIAELPLRADVDGRMHYVDDGSDGDHCYRIVSGGARLSSEVCPS